MVDPRIIDADGKPVVVKPMADSWTSKLREGENDPGQ